MSYKIEAKERVILPEHGDVNMILCDGNVTLEQGDPEAPDTWNAIALPTEVIPLFIAKLERLTSKK